MSVLYQHILLQAHRHHGLAGRNPGQPRRRQITAQILQ